MSAMPQLLGLNAMCLGLLLALTGCVSVPDGPSQMALPGTGKNFEQFRFDDSNCRNYALNQTGGKTASAQSNASFAQSAAVGTVVGAAVGAAVGGGEGAAVGAAFGGLTGTAVGSNTAQVSAVTTQQRYDAAYTQCMYASGHKVAVPRSLARQYQNQRRPVNPPAPAYYYPPPPPPGYQ